MEESKNKFSEAKAKFYIAEILIALKDLHRRNIIYRDLKPDNVVIDNDGHAKLIDFGMAKSNISDVQKGAKTFCGSVKYLAPEMLKKVGHGQALDWYLLGVLLYEMLVGITPYYSNNKDELFDNIINGKLKLPRSLSADAKSLIIGLLNRNPSKRLGSKPGNAGAYELMDHPFFKDIDWEKLERREPTGSYLPTPPKFRVSDFEQEFRETCFTESQIYDIFNEKPGKSKLKDKLKTSTVQNWEFVRKPQ